MSMSIRVNGGNVTTEQTYTEFQMISIVNQSASDGANATVTLNGGVIRIKPGQAWSLPYVGKPYASITLTPGAADVDVTLVP